MGAGSLPYGVIREVWKAVWGDDVTVAKRSAANQHRVRCPYHLPCFANRCTTGALTAGSGNVERRDAG